MGLPELPLHSLVAPLLLVLLLLPSTSPSTSTSTSTSIFFHSHYRLLLLLVSASFSSVSPSTSPDTQQSGILCQERDDDLHWVSTFPSKSASSKAWGYASVNLCLFYKLFLGCRLLFDRVINSPPNQFLSFFLLLRPGPKHGTRAGNEPEREWVLTSKYCFFSPKIFQYGIVLYVF